MVWSWSDVGAPAIDERRVRDAIAMEETGSICVVNEYEDLGFMDLRSSGGSSYGGSICDFSVGGDRLFALHSEENVFDIWETPPAPIT
ncbi:BTB/POZ domain-containing protein [Camellia lanceoleosa]|uniref:BTB/POZ domain-containing protein n=1 Tax=Camellia lanceoleosa TaxID=1840588 RepID=A0ACC0HXA3_9ERIC|nr:BTB/POZ domain-containing protein [Camellia lanceoleosa]